MASVISAPRRNAVKGCKHTDTRPVYLGREVPGNLNTPEIKAAQCLNCGALVTRE